jgi:uncharacterized protein (DUF433 family)
VSKRHLRKLQTTRKIIKTSIKEAKDMSTSIERIASDPKICSGKPCIKGTRIPVHIILDLLAAGESFEGIKKAYPNITDEDIRACLLYASVLADEEAGVTA